MWEHILHDFCSFKNLRCASCPRMCSVLVKVPCKLEENVYSAIVAWRSPQITIKSNCYVALLSSSPSLEIFCLLGFITRDKGVMKSTVVIVDSSNFPCTHSVFASCILCLLCMNTWRMLCLLGEWIPFIIVLNLNTCYFNQTVICYIMINTKGILPSFILSSSFILEWIIDHFF